MKVFVSRPDGGCDSYTLNHHKTASYARGAWTQVGFRDPRDTPVVDLRR